MNPKVPSAEDVAQAFRDEAAKWPGMDESEGIKAWFWFRTGHAALSAELERVKGAIPMIQTSKWSRDNAREAIANGVTAIATPWMLDCITDADTAAILAARLAKGATT
jgi:hypothetical protein